MNTDDPIFQALKALGARGTGRGRGKSAAPADFAAEGQLPLEALAVNVSGLGVLSQGLSVQQAQALHAASTPAPYGLRERTLVDAKVRHTGEIAAEHVTLQWSSQGLASLQAQVAAALGLQDLQARLHKLLVYGPGQFFKPHQDTEKHAGMVGTLVLVWPSAHIGGELQVWQGDSVQQFASQHLQAKALRWCAFYADCRHEVKPVQEGWRVVLSFDLVLPSPATLAPTAAHPALVKALREVFVAGGSLRRDPWLLLLDHEYTERGLRWALLKGQDRGRVAALRAAAQALGLVAQLALTEIHQSWTATGAYHGRGRYDNGPPERDELIEESLTLDFWVDDQDRCHKGQALHLSLHDCVSFTQEHDDFLVNEEYEGYMGNYGETLDYWYRRAALVLQSPAAAAASRFATHPDAALADAVKLARRPDQHEALALRLQHAMPDLQRYARSKGRTVLAKYARLATALPPSLAAELCAPFEWQHLQPGDAAALAMLAQGQGQDWLLALLRTWVDARTQRVAWDWPEHETGAAGTSPTGLGPQPLPAFITACAAAGLSGTVQEEIAALALHLLVQADKPAATPAQRLAAAPRRMQALCQLAQAMQGLPQVTAAQRQVSNLLQHVVSHEHRYPLRSLVPLLRALSSSAALTLPACQALHQRVRAALQALLQQPLPAAEDQGLREVEWTCRCTDCKGAIDWAESPTAQPLQMSLAEARRHHVQQTFEAAAAPLGFQLLKQGSPYKLVLTKPPGLHGQRQQEQAQWRNELAALDSFAAGQGRG